MIPETWLDGRVALACAFDIMPIMLLAVVENAFRCEKEIGHDEWEMGSPGILVF